MENKELLKDTAEKMGVVLTEDMLEKFMVYNLYFEYLIPPITITDRRHSHLLY